MSNGNRTVTYTVTTGLADADATGSFSFAANSVVGANTGVSNGAAITINVKGLSLTQAP